MFTAFLHFQPLRQLGTFHYEHIAICLKALLYRLDSLLLPATCSDDSRRCTITAGMNL